MAKYVGVDWAGSGWCVVTLRDDGDPTTDVVASICNVWHEHGDAERILVDIPIGLAETGKRACDVRAKDLLTPTRHASVFWPPVRAALSARTLAEAKAITEDHGFTLSNQAWAILPRVRELDSFFALVPEAVATIRESHPEVCFAALNDGAPMAHGKHSDEGLAERTTLLFDHDPSLEAVYDDAVATFIEPPPYARRLGADGRADVVDALVLAHTANRSAQRLGTLPTDPPIDDTVRPPRPMEIVYPAV